MPVVVVTGTLVGILAMPVVVVTGTLVGILAML